MTAQRSSGGQFLLHLASIIVSVIMMPHLAHAYSLVLNCEPPTNDRWPNASAVVVGGALTQLTAVGCTLPSVVVETSRQYTSEGGATAAWGRSVQLTRCNVTAGVTVSQRFAHADASVVPPSNRSEPVNVTLENSEVLGKPLTCRREARMTHVAGSLLFDVRRTVLAHGFLADRGSVRHLA